MALLMCNTSNVHEMKFGRPQTVLVTDEARPNGIIVTLGDTQEKTSRELDHVHTIKEEAGEAVIGKFIVVAPEINVQQYRMVDGQIGKFRLEVGETYSAYELRKLDRIEYSEGYFMNPGALKVGDKVNVQAKGAEGQRFVKASGATGAMRVVSIVDLWMPVMLAANDGVAQIGGQDAKLMPASVKMIKVEVEK